MKLVEENNPILKTICDPFDFENPLMDPHKLEEELQKIRIAGNGVGLAAPQVGINTRVLVLGTTSEFQMSYFNPIIAAVGAAEEYFIEGCLSYPGLFVKIKRPKDIAIVWWDADGEQHDMKYNQMVSRILQHEIDHLNGITFLERANRYHLEKARKELKIYNRRKRKINA